MHKHVKKIAVYGGAFDPPHKGHLGIIHQLASMDFLEEVWLLPSGDRNDKKLVLNMQQRSEVLLQLIDNVSHKQKVAKDIEDDEEQIENKDSQQKVKVSFQQIQLSNEKKRMINTAQLFQHFHHKYQNCEFYFTIGGDILSTIHTWENYNNLLNNINFIIFPRKGYSLNNENMPKNYILSPYIPEEISSSFIKTTLLDENISKEDKMEKVGNFLENKTIELLKKQSYL